MNVNISESCLFQSKKKNNGSIFYSAGVRVKWTVPNLSPNQAHDILSYELYARQDVGPSEQWLRMACMQALPLPMGCNLRKVKHQKDVSILHLKRKLQ